MMQKHVINKLYIKGGTNFNSNKKTFFVNALFLLQYFHQRDTKNEREALFAHVSQFLHYHTSNGNCSFLIVRKVLIFKEGYF